MEVSVGLLRVGDGKCLGGSGIEGRRVDDVDGDGAGCELVGGSIVAT